MAITPKISQVSVEGLAGLGAPNELVSQVSTESLVGREPTKGDVSQSAVEAVAGREPTTGRVSQVAVEALMGKTNGLANCPLFSGDKEFVLPPGTLAGNSLYSWRVTPLYPGGGRGPASRCCAFIPVNNNVNVSQVAVEVLRATVPSDGVN